MKNDFAFTFFCFLLRFWSYIGVCFILLINYPFVEPKFFFGSLFTIDIMELFTAIFIFLVFAYNKIIDFFKQPQVADEEIL